LALYKEEVVDNDMLLMVLVAIIVLALIGARAWPEKFNAIIEFLGFKASVTGEGNASEPSAIQVPTQPLDEARVSSQTMGESPGAVQVGRDLNQTMTGSPGGSQIGGNVTIGSGEDRDAKPSSD
jgi:hypothetical protein